MLHLCTAESPEEHAFPLLYNVMRHFVVVYYCRTYEKAVSGGRERQKGGHVLRDTTSRGLCVRVWPPHTSERRGGGRGCEQGGWRYRGARGGVVRESCSKPRPNPREPNPKPTPQIA